MMDPRDFEVTLKAKVDFDSWYERNKVVLARTLGMPCDELFFKNALLMAWVGSLCFASRNKP